MNSRVTNPMSSLQTLLVSPEFQRFFSQEESVLPTFQNQRVLARGIKNDEMLDLLEMKSVAMRSPEKANASLPFVADGRGARISWTYGAGNDGYRAVVYFRPDKFTVESGHDHRYLQNLDPLHRQHKEQENPYVVRAEGDLQLDDILY